MLRPDRLISFTWSNLQVDFFIAHKQKSIITSFVKIAMYFSKLYVLVSLLVVDQGVVVSYRVFHREYKNHEIEKKATAMLSVNFIMLSERSFP